MGKGKMTGVIYCIAVLWLTCCGLHSYAYGLNDELRGVSLHVISPKDSKQNDYVQGADPFVLRADNSKNYLYITNRPGINVPVFVSTDFNIWSPIGDAMPKLPSWAKEGFTWAPEAIKLASGGYVLYYTAKDSDTDKQCIGRAISMDPAGPFVDKSRRPFLCNKETDTSIDPSPFVDNDGKMYILWKTKKEAKNKQVKTKIWIRLLTPDGQTADDKATVLLENDQPWEGQHVEAPTLIKLQGKYILFYSAGATSSSGYSISYAVSDSIVGPYKKVHNQPLVSKGKYLNGPGHQAIYNIGPNSFMLFYHSVHRERADQKNKPARYIDYSYICFDGINPIVQDMKCKVP
jgi:beta-xylosidase